MIKISPYLIKSEEDVKVYMETFSDASPTSLITTKLSKAEYEQIMKFLDKLYWEVLNRS